MEWAKHVYQCHDLHASRAVLAQKAILCSYSKDTQAYLTFLYIQRSRRTRSEPLGDPAYSLNHSKGSSLVKTARYFLPPFSVSSVSSVRKLWNLASASLPVSKARKKM